MDDFVADVDGGAVFLQRLFHDLDRAVDARAKAAREKGAAARVKENARTAKAARTPFNLLIGEKRGL
jgi:hypothetical protein